MNASTKKMGVIAATAIVAGNMMSSGICMLPSYLADIGSITMFSWIGTIIGALALGYIFAKLSVVNPQTGGIVAYAEEVSPLIGFQSAVIYILSNWIGNVGIAITGVSYLSMQFPLFNHPLDAALLAIGIIWLLVFLNSLGATWIGDIATVSLVVLLIPVIVTLTYGVHLFDWSLFIQNWNVKHTSSYTAIAGGITICLWGFSGLESASTNADLTENPRRTIPIATMVGISLCALVYLMSSSILLGIFPAKILASSSAPFALASAKFIGEWSAPAVCYITAFACFASLGSWMMMLGQASLRAGQEGVFSKIFTIVNARNIPIRGLFIQGIIMSVILLVLALFSKDAHDLFGHLVSISILLLVFPYFYVVLNYLRSHYIIQSEFFRSFVCALAAFFCFSAFIGSQQSALEITVIFFLIVFLFYRGKIANKTPSNPL